MTRDYRCSVCKQPGHNRTSCPTVGITTDITEHSGINQFLPDGKSSENADSGLSHPEITVSNLDIPTSSRDTTPSTSSLDGNNISHYNEFEYNEFDPISNILELTRVDSVLDQDILELERYKSTDDDNNCSNLSLSAQVRCKKKYLATLKARRDAHQLIDRSIVQEQTKEYMDCLQADRLRDIEKQNEDEKSTQTQILMSEISELENKQFAIRQKTKHQTTTPEEFNNLNTEMDKLRNKTRILKDQLGAL